MNFKNKKVLLMFLMIVIGAILLACSTDDYELTKREMLLDYDEFWNILEENYLYLEILENRGLNIEEVKSEYKYKVENAKNFDEYKLILIELMDKKLKNEGHLNIVTNKLFNYVNNNILKNTNYNNKENQGFNQRYEYVFKPFEDEEVKERYEKMAEKEDYENDKERVEADNVVDSLSKANIHSLTEEKTLVIEYPSFINEYINENNKKISKALSEKPYERVIIDIRKNTGGSDEAWLNMVSMFLDEDLHYKQNYLSKGELPNKYLSEFVENGGMSKGKIDEELYSYSTSRIILSNKQIENNPDIYIIINDKTYSAALAFAEFSQEQKFATVLGSSSVTGGGGLVDPMVYKLPKSDLLFRFNPVIRSTYNNTPIDPLVEPDIFIKEDLGYKECIEKINEFEKQ